MTLPTFYHINHLQHFYLPLHSVYYLSLLLQIVYYSLCK